MKHNDVHDCPVSGLSQPQASIRIDGITAGPDYDFSVSFNKKKNVAPVVVEKKKKNKFCCIS
jgi:hypothetical protein